MFADGWSNSNSLFQCMAGTTERNLIHDFQSLVGFSVLPWCSVLVKLVDRGPSFAMASFWHKMGK